MTFDDVTEQRMATKFVVLETPKQTAKMMKEAGKVPKVSRSFVNKWPRRFSIGRDSVLDDDRPGRIGNVMESDGRVTVAELASMFDISYGISYNSHRMFRYVKSFSSLDTQTTV